MTPSSRFLIVGARLLALVGWVSTSDVVAADAKEINSAVRKLAAAVEKKDAEGTKKEAEAITKMITGMDEAMHAFALRSKKGLGVGDKAGSITPDGIEAKLQALGKKAISKGDLAKQSKALVQMSHDMSAVAEVALLNKPGQGVQMWTGWAQDMSKAAKDLADAVKEMNPVAVKAAATKVDGACTACHEKFR